MMYDAAADSFPVRLTVSQDAHEPLRNVTVFASGKGNPYRLVSQTDSGVNNGIIDAKTCVGERLSFFKPGYRSLEYVIEKPISEISLRMDRCPTMDVTDVSVDVDASGTLKVVLNSTSYEGPPVVLCSQAGNPGKPITMGQTDTGVYSSAIPLSEDLELNGVLAFRGKSRQGETSCWFTTFALARVLRGQDPFGPESTSFNGNMGLSFPPGSLRGEGYVVATWTPHCDAVPDSAHVQVGKAQRLSFSRGLELCAPAKVRLSVHEALLGKAVGSFELCRWDAGSSKWIPLSSEVDERFRAIEGPVKEPGIFSVFGKLKME